MLAMPTGIVTGASRGLGLALAVFLSWEGERLQPDEIKIGVIVIIAAAFSIRMVAIARGMKGWRFV